ncbi:MAG: hypothetical protein AB1679_16405 [Actinomycetota bacterium]
MTATGQSLATAIPGDDSAGFDDLERRWWARRPLMCPEVGRLLQRYSMARSTS